VNNLPETFEELARFRQGMYKIFSAAFLAPTPERLGDLIVGADTLEALGLPYLAFYTEWLPWRRALNSIHDVIDVEVEYVRMFTTGVSGASCPPTESFYTADPIRGEVGEVLANLAATYNAFRLEPTGTVSDTLDHISIELEVMSALCCYEAEARGDENQRRMDIMLDNELSFLEEHLSVWLPMFVDRVSAAESMPLFASLGPAVLSFVHHDLGVVRFLSTQSQPAKSVP
jgi:TorA maturation chaperone TorD